MLNLRKRGGGGGEEARVRTQFNQMKIVKNNYLNYLTHLKKITKKQFVFIKKRKKKRGGGGGGRKPDM